MKAKAAGWTWKNTVEKRRAAKRYKYSTELMNELPREWRAELLTVEVGARGLVGQETKQDVHNLFRILGRNKDAKQQAEKCIAEARRRAMLGSYLVWHHRDREEWDITETIGRWRGQHEGTSLASVDRARQKREREEQGGGRRGHGWWDRWKGGSWSQREASQGSWSDDRWRR